MDTPVSISARGKVQISRVRWIWVALLVGLAAVTAPCPILAQEPGTLAPNYPQWGFGLGLGLQWAAFDGVNDLFAAVEHEYLQQGYPVGPQRFENDQATIWSFDFRLQLSPSVALLFEYAGEVSGVAGLKCTSALFMYSFGKSRYANVRPFLGAGIGRYSFEISEPYGDAVSSPDWANCSEILEAVVVEGAGTGYVFAGGIDLARMSRVVVTVYGNYVYVPPVDVNPTSVVRGSVSVNAAALGVSFTLVFP